MKEKNIKNNSITNAVTTPGGMLLGILGEINDVKVLHVKRNGRNEFCDVKYIISQLDKPIEK